MPHLDTRQTAFKVNRCQKHVTKFDPKYMTKSQICFMSLSKTWEFVSEFKVSVHTSHTHFRSELGVSSFRVLLNKASILTSKATLQKKRSFRFLQPHLFQIELRRYRPSIHFYTETISIRKAHTQIDCCFPYAILSPCISPFVQRIVSAHVALEPWTSRDYFCWVSVMELQKWWSWQVPGAPEIAKKRMEKLRGLVTWQWKNYPLKMYWYLLLKMGDIL